MNYVYTVMCVQNIAMVGQNSQIIPGRLNPSPGSIHVPG